MAITLADFNKIWASTSPLTPYSFSESNYKQGWNFIGSTPPARQMWDFLQKNNDEKMQYLANNYLPLSGGTMTGAITTTESIFIKRNSDNSNILILGGTTISDGGYLGLYGKNHSSNAGNFALNANNGTNSILFLGRPDGRLTWGGKEVERVNASGTNYIRYESGLQICWGTTSDPSGKCTYTFPVAFNAIPNIQLSVRTGPDDTTMWLCKIANETVTDFTAITTNLSGVATQIRTYYLAVGFWK